MSPFSTIQEAITRSLREEIVVGRLRPGSRLVVEDLAAKFGVSPMPVREALRQLGAERLLVIHSYRGATVAELSIGEIEEIFQIREILEGDAARRGAPRLSDADKIRLQRLMDDMRRTTRHHSRWLTADRAFHMTLYQAAGSPRITALVGQLRQDIERYVRLYIALETNIPRSMRRHEDILTASLASDGAGARQATVEHLRETAAMFISELKRSEVDRDRGALGGGRQGRRTAPKFRAAVPAGGERR